MLHLICQCCDVIAVCTINIFLHYTSWVSGKRNVFVWILFHRLVLLKSIREANFHDPSWVSDKGFLQAWWRVSPDLLPAQGQTVIAWEANFINALQTDSAINRRVFAGLWYVQCYDIEDTPALQWAIGLFNTLHFGLFWRIIAIMSMMYMSTVRCCNNTAIFLQNSHQRHPIACLLGRGMGCILWVQTLIHSLMQSVRWWMQYHMLYWTVLSQHSTVFEYWPSYIVCVTPSFQGWAPSARHPALGPGHASRRYPWRWESVTCTNHI